MQKREYDQYEDAALISPAGEWAIFGMCVVLAIVCGVGLFKMIVS